MFVQLSDCDLIKNLTEHAPRMSFPSLTIRIPGGYQEMSSILAEQKSELKVNQGTGSDDQRIGTQNEPESADTKIGT
jgi:hypothetical protein